MLGTGWADYYRLMERARRREENCPGAAGGALERPAERGAQEHACQHHGGGSWTLPRRPSGTALHIWVDVRKRRPRSRQAPRRAAVSFPSTRSAQTTVRRSRATIAASDPGNGTRGKRRSRGRSATRHASGRVWHTTR